MGSDCCGGNSAQEAHAVAGPSHETANNTTEHHDHEHANGHGHGHGHDHDHDHGSHAGHGQDHGSSDGQSLATQDEQHAHCTDETDCAAKGDICNDDACCDSDDNCSQSATLACCDSNEENCNG